MHPYLKNKHTGAPGASFLIGPEGGFSPAELAAFDDAHKQQAGAAAAGGLRSVSLGPMVLRAETAVSAALACFAGWREARGGAGGL